MQNKLQSMLSKMNPTEINQLSKHLGVSNNFVLGLKNGRHDKYRVVYIDRIYRHFGLERDKRYMQNLRRWNAKTFSVIGTILRLARTEAGYTVEDVAKLLRGDKRQIHRIEQGDSLPSFQSYYITEMMKLYDMNELEKEKISRGILILQDLMKILKKYDDVNT